jgi:hypothetical protein
MIKKAQGQQTSIAADLPARKVRANGSVSVEAEKRVVVYSLPLLGHSERKCLVLQNPVDLDLPPILELVQPDPNPARDGSVPLS